MRGRTTLDRTDLRILSELQRNARLSNVELASRVHLSTTPCSERVRRLERLQFITGYRAELNAPLLGYPLLTLLEARLNDASAASIERFKASIQDIAGIVACHVVAGDCDVVLQCRTTDQAGIDRLLSSGTPPLRCQMSVVRLHLALQELKSNDVITIDEAAVSG